MAYLKAIHKKYGIKRLVYYELFDTFEAAVQREKKLERWRRQWKIALIKSVNLEWNDLSRFLNV